MSCRQYHKTIGKFSLRYHMCDLVSLIICISHWPVFKYVHKNFEQWTWFTWERFSMSPGCIKFQHDVEFLLKFYRVFYILCINIQSNPQIRCIFSRGIMGTIPELSALTPERRRIMENILKVFFRQRRSFLRDWTFFLTLLRDAMWRFLNFITLIGVI